MLMVLWSGQEEGGKGALMLRIGSKYLNLPRVFTIPGFAFRLYTERQLHAHNGNPIIIQVITPNNTSRQISFPNKGRI